MAKVSDKRIWNFISNFYCCKMTAEDISILYYVKHGKGLRVEDTENMMCYAVVRDDDLEYAGLEMTIAQLQEWLDSKGIRKVAQKRRKPSYALYD